VPPADPPALDEPPADPPALDVPPADPPEVEPPPLDPPAAEPPSVPPVTTTEFPPQLNASMHITISKRITGSSSRTAWNAIGTLCTTTYTGLAAVFTLSPW
jgi:hypothetical protein